MTQIEVLKHVAENGPLAVPDIPASRNTFYAIRSKKLVKSAGERRPGTVGRPAKLYAVSAKGEKLLQRAA